MTEGTKPASLGDIVSSATRARRTATVCVAGHLVDEFDQLERRLSDLTQQARQTDSLDDPASDERSVIAERIEAVREQMRAHEHSFTFEALHPKEWSDLAALHPPRQDHREAFNVETFPKAACVASLVQVNGVDVDASAPALFTALWTDRLNEGQRGDLFDAAWAANTGRISVPFSAVASATLRNIEEK